MKFYYNTIDKACKSIIGSIRKNEKLNINVICDEEGECVLFLCRDGQKERAYPMQKTSGGFFVCLSGLEEGIYWYYFVVNGIRVGLGEKQRAKIGSFENFQLSVYADDYQTPNWFKGGICYQIFADRFYKSGNFIVSSDKVKRDDWGGEPTYKNKDGLALNNEFFGGNFKGITEKLEYLKSLNVTCIYFNPLCKAYSSHRYDTSDYLSFDSVLGTMDDFKNLKEKADKLNIALIFDGVYNHVGADSIYFNKYGSYEEKGAYNSKNSAFYNWFTFNEFPEKYESWWGFETLPSIRKDSESFQSFICEKVIKHNFDIGFKGVRLDVVDELSDEFVENIRLESRKNFKDALLIGEVWEDASNKIAYGVRRKYFLGNELDSVMNYPLKNGIISFLKTGKTDFLEEVVTGQINNFPKSALDCMLNVLSTHDSIRIISELGHNYIGTDKDLMHNIKLKGAEYERGKKLLKLAYVLTYTLYGVPSVYYGDEAGLDGLLDPYNRRCFPWDNIDGELLNFFIKLGEIRKNQAVFIDGETKIIYTLDGVFVYERTCENEQIFVAVSMSKSQVEIEFDCEMTDLFLDKNIGKSLLLSSESFAILTTKK